MKCRLKFSGGISFIPSQCASSQFIPTPTSATSGTFNIPSSTFAIICGSFSLTKSSSASGTSNTSSSCTCIISLLCKRSSESQRDTSIMARLMRSEAVPCMGALMAARSAPARALAFLLWMSGR